MAKQEIEGLVLLLDVGVSMSTRLGTSTYLQSCADIIQMIVQRKMFQSSKDELALVLFGTTNTANELWDGRTDHYSHVTLARPLSIVDWKLLEFIQNDISASNLSADILDGLVVASNHFHEDLNKKKVFKEKRIIVFTDFSSHTEDLERVNELSSSLAKYSIRVDIVSPFDENDVEEDETNDEDDERKEDRSSTANNFKATRTNKQEKKSLTQEQRQIYKALMQICDHTGGAMYSFDEVLALLSMYQAKCVKSTGTKYTLTIGESFKLPIVSMIKCKENKPELFRFKKVYAKDDTVQLKTDRARFTKDDEQRDLDEKTDVVDAYRYGATYVPIDNPESLRLSVEKCFTVLGFTKSENVQRHYYLGDSVQQIMPDVAAGLEAEEAFVNMVHSMYAEDVYGIVRRVFNSRSSPELGCLIPFISNDTVCLLYISLPFEDDMKKFTLENFNKIKKYKPNEEQLKLVDSLMDSMDLTKKKNDLNGDEKYEGEDQVNEEEEEDLYDPHLTFNPYIQRMFQSIALRATNPNAELPDFETHLTNSHLVKIGEKVRNENTLKLLKRCAEEFPIKVDTKKTKQRDENMFQSQRKEQTNEEKRDTEELSANKDEKNFAFDELMSSSANSNIKRVGTVTPVDDFKLLAERIMNSTSSASACSTLNDFEELCSQIQVRIQDLFNESLREINDLNEHAAQAFQERVYQCIKIYREYSIKLSLPYDFNTFLKSFKLFLINESRKANVSVIIESFWKNYFVNLNLTLISSLDCSCSDISLSESDSFLQTLFEAKRENNIVDNSKIKESEEDLLDLM